MTQRTIARNESSRHFRRGGYALLLVIIFIALFLAMLGVAWRGVASALRVASTRSIQVQRDEGCLRALAGATRLLETGLPPGNSYVCGVSLNTPAGNRSYTVTYTLHEDATWTVNCRPTQPGETPPSMPDSFVQETP